MLLYVFCCSDCSKRFQCPFNQRRDLGLFVVVVVAVLSTALLSGTTRSSSLILWTVVPRYPWDIGPGLSNPLDAKISRYLSPLYKMISIVSPPYWRVLHLSIQLTANLQWIESTVMIWRSSCISYPAWESVISPESWLFLLEDNVRNQAQNARHPHCYWADLVLYLMSVEEFLKYLLTFTVCLELYWTPRRD